MFYKTPIEVCDETFKVHVTIFKPLYYDLTHQPLIAIYYLELFVRVKLSGSFKRTGTAAMYCKPKNGRAVHVICSVNAYFTSSLSVSHFFRKKQNIV